MSQGEETRGQDGGAVTSGAELGSGLKTGPCVDPRGPGAGSGLLVLAAGLRLCKKSTLGETEGRVSRKLWIIFETSLSV